LKDEQWNKSSHNRTFGDQVVAERYWETRNAAFYMVNPLIIPFYVLFWGVADLYPAFISFYRSNPLLYPSNCFKGVADLYHVVMLFVPCIEVDEREVRIVVKVDRL